jgi:ATP-dependent exoDNAse (exonuclease V) alpha subunit
MIADLNVHWDRGADGQPKPHAHVMLTMRSVDENGFGPKVRELERDPDGRALARRLGRAGNERLAELDIDARIDHRSLEAQGVALEPQTKIGAPRKRIEAAGLEADRAEDHRRIARENGARIVADPSIALDAITQQQSPSRGATWPCSPIGTATGSTSSTPSWARCGARPSWSNSARTGMARTASPPAT